MRTAYEEGGVWWTHAFTDAELQAAILHHVDAVVGVTGTEQALPLVQLHKHHVSTKLQEQRLLKVSQHPGQTHTCTHTTQNTLERFYSQRCMFVETS